MRALQLCLSLLSALCLNVSVGLAQGNEHGKQDQRVGNEEQAGPSESHFDAEQGDRAEDAGPDVVSSAQSTNGTVVNQRNGQGEEAVASGGEDENPVDGIEAAAELGQAGDSSREAEELAHQDDGEQDYTTHLEF